MTFAWIVHSDHSEHGPSTLRGTTGIMWYRPNPRRAGKLCGGYVLCLHHPFTARHFRGPGVHAKEGGSDFILHPQKNNPLQRTDTTNYTRTHHPTTLRLGYDRTDQTYTQPCTMPPKSFKDKYLRSRPTLIQLNRSLARVNIPLQP